MSTLQSSNIEPLVNYFQPGKLADLSAVSFVNGILHEKLLHMRRDTEMRTSIYDSPDLDQIDSIPKSILSNLKELITRTKKSWTEWWLHHYKKVFFQQLPTDDMIDWFDHLVWFPDGTINYEQTVRKMLNNEKLTNVRKFQLACAYCLIDDVERLKQTLTSREMKKATNGRCRYRDEFFNYWSRRVRLERNVKYENLLGELIKSFDEFYDFQPQDHSMYRLKPYDEWLAINFFLNQIPIRKRWSNIKDIIKLDKPRLIWLLLPTLSDIELNSILSEKGHRIMKTLLINRFYFEFTVSVWDHMVHVIDNSELAKIILHVNDLTFERSYVNDLLWRMWLVISERQKKFIVDERICDFTEEYWSLHWNDYYSPNFPLIIDVLSRSSPENRYRYWKKHWPYLVIGQLDHRRFIELIMNLCFTNDQQIQDFKKTSMMEYNSIIEEYFNVLLKEQRLQDIQTFVEFCTSDPQLIRDVKKNIVKKMPKDELFDLFFYRHSDEIVADFNHFLEDVFTENKRKKFFYKMVTCRDNLKKLRKMVSWGNLPCVIKFIETFVSSEKSLTNVKLHFFERCCCKRSIQKSVRLDLMAWCLNGDRLLVDNFQKIISSKKERVSDNEESSSDEEPRKKIKLEPPRRDVYEIFIETYRRLGSSCESFV